MRLTKSILSRMAEKDRAALLGQSPSAPSAESKYLGREERRIQSEISALLRLREVPFINPPMHRRSHLPVGWPDFTLAWRGFPVVLEVKVGGAAPRCEQRECALRLIDHGWRYATVHSSGEAMEFLRNIDQELNDEVQ